MAYIMTLKTNRETGEIEGKRFDFETDAEDVFKSEAEIIQYAIEKSGWVLSDDAKNHTGCDDGIISEDLCVIGRICDLDEDHQIIYEGFGCAFLDIPGLYMGDA